VGPPKLNGIVFQFSSIPSCAFELSSSCNHGVQRGSWIRFRRRFSQPESWLVMGTVWLDDKTWGATGLEGGQQPTWYTMVYPQFEPFKLIGLGVRPGGFLKELSDSQGCGLCGLSRANDVNLEGCIQRTMTNPKALKLILIFYQLLLNFDGALPFQFGGNPHR
jgi:hypothetical protein